MSRKLVILARFSEEDIPETTVLFLNKKKALKDIPQNFEKCNTTNANEIVISNFTPTIISGDIYQQHLDSCRSKRLGLSSRQRGVSGRLQRHSLEFPTSTFLHESKLSGDEPGSRRVDGIANQSKLSCSKGKYSLVLELPTKAGG